MEDSWADEMVMKPRQSRTEGLLDILSEPMAYVTEREVYECKPAYDSAEIASHCNNFYSEYP
jgi:hypothetical protein